MAERNLDIFVAMSAVDRRELDWLDRQTDEARKEFKPPVALRWAASVTDGDAAEWYLRAINERVNLNLWNISQQYPDLVFRLMASCGIGFKVKHQWLGMPERTVQGGKARDFVARFHPTASDREIEMLLGLMDLEEFARFVDESGCTPEEAKEAITAHARFKGEKPPEDPKPKSKRKRAS